MKRPWRELWILGALAFLQLCLIGLYQTIVPYLYLVLFASRDSDVAEGLEKLKKLSEASGALSPAPDELEARVAVLAPLFEKVPWLVLGILGSVSVYLVIGGLAGRFLDRPESSGLLLLLSVATGQNPAVIPLTLQHAGMGQIALPFPVVAGLLFLQFGVLGFGIVWGRIGRPKSP